VTQSAACNHHGEDISVLVRKVQSYVSLEFRRRINSYRKGLLRWDREHLDMSETRSQREQVNPYEHSSDGPTDVVSDRFSEPCYLETWQANARMRSLT
jgi:hypothetical protein